MSAAGEPPAGRPAAAFVINTGRARRMHVLAARCRAAKANGWLLAGTGRPLTVTVRSRALLVRAPGCGRT